MVARRVRMLPRPILGALLIVIVGAVVFFWYRENDVDIEEYFSRSTPDAGVLVDHADWSRLLEKYVTADEGGLNRVDYRAMKEESRDKVQRYLAYLQTTVVTKLRASEQFAFWVNLYNAQTIDIILANYPVGSIREIKPFPWIIVAGPWRKKLLWIEGINLSLDDVEHKILRPIWHDPRTHYAVNCASIGCPNLARAAYTSSNMQEMLDAAARAFVKHPRGVLVGNNGVVVSSIYKWFSEDFGGSESDVLDHIRLYANPGLLKQLDGVQTIRTYQYDWRLNDVFKPGNR